MGVSKNMIAVGILKKLGAPFTEKISTDRALKKIIRYWDNDNPLIDLTEWEIKLLKENGINPPISKVEHAQETSQESPKESTGNQAGTTQKKKVDKDTKRMDWMTAATRAIKNTNSMKRAAHDAASIYLQHGGRSTPYTEQNGILYVSYASKVLIEAGVIQISDDKITHE